MLLVTRGCLDVANGGGSAQGSLLKQVWFTELSENRREAHWPGLPAIADGMAIVGTRGGLTALDVETGARRWRSVLWDPEFRPYTMNVSAHGGRVCIADQEAAACAETATGQKFWSRVLDPFGSIGYTSMDEVGWYVGTDRGRVHALDASSGVALWVTNLDPQAKFDHRVWGTAVSGDTVYATTIRWLTRQGGEIAGDFYALDRRTGEILLRYTTPGTKGGFQGAPIIYGELAIINDTYWHGLVAINRFTGQEVWRTENDASGYINAEHMPVLVGDTVFASSTDTQIYAIHARTGQRLWRVLGNYGSLGNTAICAGWVLATEFSGGDFVAVDRRTKAVFAASGFRDTDPIRSEFAVAGNTAIAATTRGVAAFRCE